MCLVWICKDESPLVAFNVGLFQKAPYFCEGVKAKELYACHILSKWNMCI